MEQGRIPGSGRCSLSIKSVEKVARPRRARKGSRCSSSCYTKDHYSWGECVRAKGLQVSPHVNDNYSTRQTAWDRELDSYQSAVRQGLDPVGTKQRHVDAAIREADSV